MDLMEKMNKQVLFVCTGNTCRSPMATAIFNHFSEKANSSWFATSAGLATETGLPITDKAAEALLDFGIYIEDHQAHQLEARMIKDANIVLTMTETQRDLLHVYYPEFADKVMTIAEFGDYDEDVKDPFGQGISAYKEIAALFVEIMPGIVEKLTNQFDL